MFEEPENGYIPKRGDILQYVNSDGQIGFMLGWVDSEMLSIWDIEMKVIISGYSQDFKVLLKKEDLTNLDFLPRTIELKDTL